MRSDVLAYSYITVGLSTVNGPQNIFDALKFESKEALWGYIPSLSLVINGLLLLEYLFTVAGSHNLDQVV